MADEVPIPVAVSRRTFLRRVAMGGAIVLIPGAAALALRAVPTDTTPPIQHSSVPSETLRIGLLLPQSQIYPQLSQSLLRGFQLALTESSVRHVALEPRAALLPVDYGKSPAQALSTARELVTGRQVDVLSGLFSRNHADSLESLLREHQTPLLVSDIGANTISTHNKSPYIMRSSLGFWQSNLALGQWAAQQVGQRAVISTSFYESGYDTIHAFRSGFEHGGGEILATISMGAPYNGVATPAEALARIESLNPDVVYAAYSGQDAIAFVRSYAESGLHNRVPLLGTAMLVEEQLLPEIGSAAIGIRSAFSWAPSLMNPQNQAFMAAFAAHTGTQADAFAVLGYDSANLILAAAQFSGGVHNRERFHAALHNSRFDGPRGNLVIEPTYLEATAPIYLREVRQQGSSFTNQVAMQLDALAEHDPRVVELRDTLRSGWTNAYLCV